MPVYTYRREDGTTFDYKQRFLDDPLDVCPTTGQKVVRIVQTPGIIFKGSGFYVNDSKSARNGTVGKSESKTESSGKSETTAETKSESDTTAKSESKTPKSEAAAD